MIEAPDYDIRGTVDAALFLGICRDTLRKLLKNKLIPHYRIGNVYYFNSTELKKTIYKFD